MTFLRTGARLAGVMEVLGDTMGPTVANWGAVDDCLGERSWFGIGTAGTGGSIGRWSVAIGLEGVFHDGTDFLYGHGSIGRDRRGGSGVSQGWQ